MGLQKRRDNKLIVKWRKASLIDYAAVDKYIELFGTPVCMCCNTITLLPVFRRSSDHWSIFCLNCGVTRDVCGTCMHDPAEDMSIRMLNPEKSIRIMLDSD